MFLAAPCCGRCPRPGTCQKAAAQGHTSASSSPGSHVFSSHPPIIHIFHIHHPLFWGGAKKSSKKVQELNQVSPGFPGVSRGFQGFPMDGSGRISLQSKVKHGRLLIEPLVWLDQGAQLPARVPGWAGNKSHALPCPFTCFSQFRKGNVIKLLSKSGVQGKYVEHLGRKLR